MILRIIFTLLLIFTSTAMSAVEYGVYIKTYPEIKKNYTQLILDNGEFIDLNGGAITLDFSVYLRNNNPFGQVVRILSDNALTIDVIYTAGTPGTNKPAIVIDGNMYIIDHEAAPLEWTDVKIKIDPESENITFTYGDSTLTRTLPKLKDTKGLRIGFGATSFDANVLREVASVNIRDILVSNGNDTIRRWVLARHDGDICHDVTGHHPARLIDGEWLHDSESTWKEVFSRSFPTFTSIAFDNVSETFYIVSDQSHIYTYNAITGVRDSINVAGGQMVANFPNQLIYLPDRNELLSYNLDENLYSSFDFATLRWSESKMPEGQHDFWHNTINYYAADNSLVSFGGYGHFRINNTLLISDLDTQSQTAFTIDSIEPRRMCASTIVNDTLYILGGHANPLGKQEVNMTNRYDLNAIDLKTKSAKRIWDYTPKLGDFTFSENMIWDPENDCFYVFSTFWGGELLRIGRHEPGF
ncbi:MAG: hypothetical protein NC230_09415, partial [Bacteroides sp.]|nr:hypothetical protein [Bacteroides sp.]